MQLSVTFWHTVAFFDATPQINYSSVSLSHKYLLSTNNRRKRLEKWWKMSKRYIIWQKGFWVSGRLFVVLQTHKSGGRGLTGNRCESQSSGQRVPIIHSHLQQTSSPLKNPRTASSTAFLVWTNPPSVQAPASISEYKQLHTMHCLLEI